MTGLMRGTQKPASLGCRTAPEVKEMFLKKAREEGKKTQEIIEGFVLRYINGTHPSIGVRAGTTGEASQSSREIGCESHTPDDSQTNHQSKALALHGGKSKMSSILEETFAAHDQAIAPGGERIPILGHLVWYSVKETRITPAELKRLLTTLGVPQNHLPEDPSPINAFKRATSEANETFEAKIDETHTAVYLIRFAASDDKEIAKTLIKEVRDSANKRLSYEEVGKAFFDKELNVPVWIANSGCEQVVEELKKLYSDYSTYFTGKHIRAFIHDTVQSLDPTLVRPSGAVYFIPRQYTETVQKLEVLIKELDHYGVTSFNSIFESIPLIDAEKTRALVELRFEEQNTREVDRTLGELSILLKTGAEITPKTAAGYARKVQDMKRVIGKYEGLLQKEMTISRTKADILDQQVKQMIDKVYQQTITPISQAVQAQVV